MGIKLIKMKTYTLRNKNNDCWVILFIVDSKNDKVKVQFVNVDDSRKNYAYTDTLENARIRWVDAIKDEYIIE